MIKSGGEWISSIELENIAIEHPAVREAAVVAAPIRAGANGRCCSWSRPRDGPSTADMAALFEGRVARWMIPTELRIVADLPHTATGKLQKAAIRAML